MIPNKDEKDLNRTESNAEEKPLVLVVEDDIYSRRVLVSYLAGHGYDVVEAENGLEALSILESSIPDIILMDAIMPEMDGYEACQRITNNQKTEDIPILILTMLDDGESISRGFEVGAIDYIPKPYNWPLLFYRMKNIIDRIRAERDRKRIELQLRQVQKIEAIGRLTGGIAHDFNNVLASVLGYTELALEKYGSDSDEKLSIYLNEIYQSGRRAQVMVDKMLTFCRQGDDSPLPFIDVSEVVSDIISIMKPILPSRIELTVSVEGRLPKILANPVELEQVIMNLCINARDAVEGEGRIGISVASRHNVHRQCSSCGQMISGEYVEICVEDDGEGIPQATAGRLFDPYFTTKEVGKGSGMGLSVVHGIVHDTNGHIVLDSEREGARFLLYFPAHHDLPDNHLEEDETISGFQSGSGEHVLVVDDEPSLARFLSDLLQSNHYRVTVENDSLQALNAFVENPDAYDLVVTDQTMPGLSGDEMIKKMFELRPDLPVILCTGFSETIDEDKAYKMGISGFFMKPVPSHELLNKISEIFSDG
ncbi:MAG: response regulator [Gammaproteobacteria bacterium]